MKNKLIKEEKENRNFIKFVVQYLLLYISEWFYKLLFSLFRKKEEKRNYYLSVCSCFKNEGKYLKEWIEYHLIIGVDHFYLYNNNSEDNYIEVLQPYINNGIVTLLNYSDTPCQPGIYEHWYNNFRYDTTWVTFIDIDEFYCPIRYVSIKDWLNKHSKYPVLLVYWKMFGSSGLLYPDSEKLVTEQYTVCWDKYYSVGKVFYNTSYLIAKFDKIMHHSLFVKYLGINIPPINQWNHFVRWGINRCGRAELDFQLNHYWSKSYNDFEEKHKRGSSAYGISWRSFDKFLWHEQKNISVDYKIFRFLIQLKLNLNNE